MVLYVDLVKRRWFLCLYIVRYNAIDLMLLNLSETSRETTTFYGMRRRIQSTKYRLISHQTSCNNGQSYLYRPGV
jgi:hypothetical protein